jgi:hypothetical protein
VKPSAQIPTLPAIQDLDLEHPSLRGAVQFVEACHAWGAPELERWFDEALVKPGRMEKPNVVSDPVVGTAPLRADVRVRDNRVARLEDVPRLIRLARGRVVDALRAFVATPPDDRFLQAAIFAERVQRAREGKGSVWVPRPREADALGNIVLALFAADMLMHREFHEQRLCVCEVCGRVSFDRDVTTRSGCPLHVPRTGSTSGFQTSAVPPNDKE